jgi:hypothetical protein
MAAENECPDASQGWLAADRGALTTRRQWRTRWQWPNGSPACRASLRLRVNLSVSAGTARPPNWAREARAWRWVVPAPSKWSASLPMSRPMTAGMQARTTCWTASRRQVSSGWTRASIKGVSFSWINDSLGLGSFSRCGGWGTSLFTICRGSIPISSGARGNARPGRRSCTPPVWVRASAVGILQYSVRGRSRAYAIGQIGAANCAERDWAAARCTTSGLVCGPLLQVQTLLPFTNPGCPSVLPPVSLLHRRQADPVTVPEEPSGARCGGASLRALAVLRYSGPAPCATLSFVT